MDQQTFNNTMAAACQNNTMLANLVQHANNINFNTTDARNAAIACGEYVMGQQNNADVALKTMVSVYEAVLYRTMRDQSKISIPNNEYNNRMDKHFNLAVKISDAMKGESGRVAGNGVPNPFNNQNNGNTNPFANNTNNNNGGNDNPFAPKQNGNNNENPFTGNSGTPENIFGGGTDSPLNNNQTQPFVNTVENTNIEMVPTVTEVIEKAKDMYSKEYLMESLRDHETEVELRAVSASMKKAAEAVDMFKETLSELQPIAPRAEEWLVKGTESTPITLIKKCDVKEYVVPSRMVDEAKEVPQEAAELFNKITVFNTAMEKLAVEDYNQRNIMRISDNAIGIMHAIDDYLAAVKKSDDCDTYHIEAALRLKKDMRVVMYEALIRATNYVTDELGNIPSPDGSDVLALTYDYGDVAVELKEVYEDIYMTYEGAKADLWGQFYVIFAKALTESVLGFEDNTVTLTKTIAQINSRCVFFDDVEVSTKYQTVNTEKFGAAYPVITDLIEIVDKNIPNARVVICDVLGTTAYLDRPYRGGIIKYARAGE